MSLDIKETIFRKLAEDGWIEQFFKNCSSKRFLEEGVFRGEEDEKFNLENKIYETSSYEISFVIQNM